MITILGLVFVKKEDSGLNQKRELESKIDTDLEIKKQIKFEENRQLNSFSLNFYKKIKQNSIINEY